MINKSKNEIKNTIRIFIKRVINIHTWFTSTKFPPPFSKPSSSDGSATSMTSSPSKSASEGTLKNRNRNFKIKIKKAHNMLH